jgi:hypothetical protein
MKLFETWKKVMFDPLNFYEQIPKKVGYREPTLFYLKSTAIGLSILYLMFFLMGSFVLMFLGMTNMNLGLKGFGIMLLVMIISFPVIILLYWGMLYVNAAIYHLFVMLFKGKEKYKETFISLAYSGAPNMLLAVPLVNWAARVYNLVLFGIGIHKRQKLSVGKSVAVVLIPVAIGMIIFSMLYFLFIAFSIALGGIQ